jgi:uncharacterized membrane protein
MNSYKKLTALNALVVLATIAVGFGFKGQLPEFIPTKFDENGLVLKQAPIVASIFFLPIVAALTVFILTFLAKKNKVFWTKDQNQVAVAQTNLGILLLISALYVGTFLNALNFSVFSKYSFFAIGFGLFFLTSAGAMKQIEKNLLYGVRLPWTLASEENWKKTHVLTSKLMLGSGVLLVLAGLMTRNHLLILSLIGLTFIVPSFYSFNIRTQAV